MDVRPNPALLRLRASEHRIPVLVIAFFFVGSRTVAYTAGVRFGADPVGVFWQILDPHLLTTRLVESLFYLHGLPPLFSLYVGILLKVSPGHYATIAQVTYLLLGIVGALALYALLIRMGCRRWLSVAVAVLMMVAPATILNENWLFYEYPVSVLLVLSGLALAWFVRTKRFWPGFLFFGLLAAVIWTRSAFQIVWMLLAAVLVLVALRDRRKLVLQACLVPLLLVVALYVKNIAVFGLPSTSSLYGLNLAQTVFASVSQADRARRVERGELSRVSLIRPPRALDVYRTLVPPTRPTGIPVLDEATLPSGTTNFNHKAYLRISSLYFGDALHLIREEPSAYVRSVVKGLKLTLRPANIYEISEGNTAKMHSYIQSFNRVVYLQTRYAGGAGLAILGAYMLALLYGLRLLWLWIRGRGNLQPELVTLLFLWLTVLYMFLTLVLTYTGENPRVRFVIDPLVAVLVASALGEAYRGLKGKLGRRLSAEPSFGTDVTMRV